MPMPNRQIVNGEKYRYAFQGQEKDDETQKEAFQLRLWDGRIGRWLSPDPARQYHSPYMGMGNNPISRIDPDGGTDCPPGEDCVGGTIQLDEFCLNCETPLYSTEVERYSFNGTFSQYKEMYNVSGSYSQIKANWDKNHSKDFYAWTSQMDQAQKDDENRYKLTLFLAGTISLGEVMNPGSSKLAPVRGFRLKISPKSNTSKWINLNNVDDVDGMAGLYRFPDATRGNKIYTGQSIDLRVRLNTHFNNHRIGGDVQFLPMSGSDKLSREIMETIEVLSSGRGSLGNTANLRFPVSRARATLQGLNIYD